MKRALFVLPLVLLASTYGCESSSIAPSGDGGTDAGDEEVPVPSKCTTPTDPPVEHKNAVTADETWGAGYHDITFNLTIEKGATVTVAPCAIVRFAGPYTINVGNTPEGNGGKLVAKGKADEPILFEGKDGGGWGNVLVWHTGYADLAYVTMRNGGGTETSRDGGTLHLYGSQYEGFQELATVDHVTIEKSKRYGVVLETHAGFSAASKNLTIRESGELAMFVGLPSVGSIPPGKYTGNTTDAIRLVGSAAYDVLGYDQTVHDRGVPYVVGGEGSFGSLRIEGTTAVATLTVEAGVTMKFPKADRSSVIEVSSGTGARPAKGALKIVGTAQKPVTLTSSEATPQKGDWVGIVFGNVPDPSNTIDHARIEYTGGDTGIRGFSCGTPGHDDVISNEGAILILGQPAKAFVTNTTIAHSLKNGIERGWTLGQDYDFMATNTFEDIDWCKQTKPKPQTGSCPTPPLCDR